METIQIYWALLRKDLRSILLIMAALLLLNLLAVTYIAIFAKTPDYIYSKSDLFVRLIQLYRGGYEAILAAVLVLTLNLEWVSGARYQILFLPMRRYQSMFLMTATVVTLGCLVSLLTSCFGKIFVKPFGDSGNFLLFLGKRILGVGGYTLLLSGMACFAQGIMIAINRFRFAVWVFALFMAVCLYALVKNGIILEMVLHDASWSHSPLVRFFDGEAGVAFLVSGLILVNRYAEA